METETVKTQIPLPLEFSDTPDGMSDAILEYQGCPLVTVRGSDDMSCIEVEDEEKVTAECLQMALFVRRACNSHYELLEALNNIMTICYKVDSGEIHRTDEISSLIGSEINNALSKSNLLTK